MSLYTERERMIWAIVIGLVAAMLVYVSTLIWDQSQHRTDMIRDVETNRIAACVESEDVVGCLTANIP